MKDFDLSITICSWNTQSDLRDCLKSLESARDEANFEIIVVDNNSEDGSPEMVAKEFPNVRLLRQYRNLGFTGGHNLAIQEAHGRYVMLLNSDTVLHPGAIRELMSQMESHPRVGICGPKLLNPDGSLQLSCRKFPNPVAALFRNTILGKLFPKNKWVREYLMEDWDHTASREVDWVSGAALLIRPEALEKVKGLDPDFFMYCEDVDICLRCWQAGFSVNYFPTAVITHAIGRSTSQVTNRMIARFHKSMFLFFKKHQLKAVHPILRPFATLGAILALILRAGLFVAKNKWDLMQRKLGR